MLTYRIWHRERKLERLVGSSTDLGEALELLEVHSGPQEYAYITLTWKIEGVPTKTYFLINSVNGQLTMKDYRAAVWKLLRRRPWYYNGANYAKR